MHNRNDDEPDLGEADESEIDPSTIVSLTPAGRALWDQLLQECSVIAGRDITGDELSMVMKRVRADVGQEEPDFADPNVVACFFKHLQSRCISIREI